MPSSSATLVEPAPTILMSLAVPVGSSQSILPE